MAMIFYQNHFNFIIYLDIRVKAIISKKNFLNTPKKKRFIHSTDTQHPLGHSYRC